MIEFAKRGDEHKRRRKDRKPLRWGVAPKTTQRAVEGHPAVQNPEKTEQHRKFLMEKYKQGAISGLYENDNALYNDNIRRIAPERHDALLQLSIYAHEQLLLAQSEGDQDLEKYYQNSLELIADKEIRPIKLILSPL